MRAPSRPASFFVCTATHTSLPVAGVLEQQVAALARPGLDEPGSLQLADHLGPRHPVSVNLSMGFVKRAP